MKEEFRPFCYEHLTEMIPYGENPPKAETYICPELDCLVHYNAFNGYFILAKEENRTEQGAPPSIRCPNDRTPMYLAEIHPEHKSFRLWQCPQCGKSLTNQDSSRAL